METKSSLFTEDLRDREGGKIECGRAHFTALGVGESPAIYETFKGCGWVADLRILVRSALDD